LKQVALLVEDLQQDDAEVRELFGLDEGHHEPGLASFGLENSVMPVGDDQFLEIASPLRDGGTRRSVGGRRGYGGYMVIIEVGSREELADRRKKLEAQGLRVVHEIEQDDYASIHVHPKDLGTLVSFDWCGGEWPGVADDWRDHVRTDVIQGIRGIELHASSPDELARRWSATLGLPVRDGVLTLPGDGSVVRFAARATDKEPGLNTVEVRATDRSRAGETRRCGEVEFRFV
jgi:hypothetical protein